MGTPGCQISLRPVLPMRGASPTLPRTFEDCSAAAAHMWNSMLMRGSTQLLNADPRLSAKGAKKEATCCNDGGGGSLASEQLLDPWQDRGRPQFPLLLCHGFRCRQIVPQQVRANAEERSTDELV